VFRSNFSQEVVNKHYASELKEQTNLYGSPLSQTERFRNCLKYFSFKGKRILDIGCGRGDFLVYLEKKGQSPLFFSGLDPYGEMIKISKKRETSRTKTKTSWYCVDFLKARNYGADILTAFSAFDRKFGNHPDSKIYVEKVIEKMIAEAKEGIYVTFLSAYKNINNYGEFLFYPEEVFRYARTFSERVIIDNSYAPHAFSLIVYTQKSDWRKAWEKGRWK